MSQKLYFRIRALLAQCSEEQNIAAHAYAIEISVVGSEHYWQTFADELARLIRFSE